MMSLADDHHVITDAVTVNALCESLYEVVFGSVFCQFQGCLSSSHGFARVSPPGSRALVSLLTSSWLHAIRVSARLTSGLDTMYRGTFSWLCFSNSSNWDRSHVQARSLQITRVKQQIRCRNFIWGSWVVLMFSVEMDETLNSVVFVRSLLSQHHFMCGYY